MAESFEWIMCIFNCLITHYWMGWHFKWLASWCPFYYRFEWSARRCLLLHWLDNPFKSMWHCGLNVTGLAFKLKWKQIFILSVKNITNPKHANSTKIIVHEIIPSQIVNQVKKKKTKLNSNNDLFVTIQRITKIIVISSYEQKKKPSLFP